MLHGVGGVLVHLPSLIVRAILCVTLDLDGIGQGAVIVLYQARGTDSVRATEI